MLSTRRMYVCMYVCLPVRPCVRMLWCLQLSCQQASRAPKSVRTPQVHARKVHQIRALATGGSVKPAVLETAETLVAGVGAGQRLSLLLVYFQKAVAQGSSSPTTAS